MLKVVQHTQEIEKVTSDFEQKMETLKVRYMKILYRYYHKINSIKQGEVRKKMRDL